MKRIASLIALCITAIALLSGCVSASADITLGADASGTGFIDLAADKGTAAEVGIFSLDQFRSADTSQGGKTPGSPTFAQSSTTYFENDMSFVKRVSFTNQALTDANFRASREGGTVKFFYSHNPASMGQAGPAGTIAELGGMIGFTVRFPGTLQNVVGAQQFDQQTIRVNQSLSEPFAVEAVSAVSVTPPPALPVVTTAKATTTTTPPTTLEPASDDYAIAQKAYSNSPAPKPDANNDWLVFLGIGIGVATLGATGVVYFVRRKRSGLYGNFH